MQSIDFLTILTLLLSMLELGLLAGEALLSNLLKKRGTVEMHT